MLLLAAVAGGGGVAQDGFSEQEIDTLSGRAVELALDGRFAEAIEPAREAIEVAKILDPKHPALGRLLHNLARLYSSLNRFEEAELITRHEVKVVEAAVGPDHPDTALALDALATIYFAQARYAEAAELAKRVLAISEKAHGKDNLLISSPLGNLARIDIAQGRFAEAEVLIRRDLALAEKVAGAESPEARQALVNLAALQERQGRYAAAEPLLARAASLAERDLGPEHPQYAVLLTSLAALHIAQGRYPAAEPLVKRALTIAEASVGTDSQIYAHALFQSGALAFAQRRWSEALSALERVASASLTRARRSGDTAGSALVGPPESRPLRLDTVLTTLIRAAQRLAEAEPSRADALSEQMFRTAQWARGPDAGASAPQLAAQQGKSDAQLAALVRERQDLVAEWQSKDRSLVGVRSGLALTRDFAGEKVLVTRLAAIDARLATIDKALAKDFPRYAALANATPLTASETRALLRPNDAVAFFLTLDAFGPDAEATLLWVVTPTASRWVRIDLGPRALAESVDALRCGLDRAAAGSCQPSSPVGQAPAGADVLAFDLQRAHKLYAQLFGNVEDLVADKHLLVVPAGPLAALPFHALVTKAPSAPAPGTDPYTQADWLIKRQAVTVLPSITSLKLINQPHAKPADVAFIGFGAPMPTGGKGQSKSTAAVADPCAAAASDATPAPASAQLPAQDYFARGAVNLEVLRRHAPLADAAAELCAMARALGADLKRVHLGEDATERSLRALSVDGTLAGARVVHFATAGVLAGDTEAMLRARAETGLMLTPPAEISEEGDGLLTAAEVTTLKLNAGWVILSGGGTAAGGSAGAEASLALPRAFLQAGARALLVAHWRPDAKAALQLATAALDTEQQEPAIGRSEALRRSMLAMLQDGGPSAHPSNWGAFALVGDGSGEAAEGAAPTVVGAASDTGSLRDEQAAAPSGTSAAAPAAGQPVEAVTGALRPTGSASSPVEGAPTTVATVVEPSGAAAVVPAAAGETPPLPISKKSLFKRRKRPEGTWDWLFDLFSSPEN